MANMSNYLEQKLLGVSLLGSPFTAPSTVFLSLATTLASDGDFFTEVVSGLGYTRIPVDFSEPTSPNDYTVVNSADVPFSAATTPWGNVTHFAYFDTEAIGAGNMLYWGVMTADRDVLTNDVVEFQAGFLTVKLD